MRNLLLLLLTSATDLAGCTELLLLLLLIMMMITDHDFSLLIPGEAIILTKFKSEMDLTPAGR